MERRLILARVCIGLRNNNVSNGITSEVSKVSGVSIASNGKTSNGETSNGKVSNGEVSKVFSDSSNMFGGKPKRKNSKKKSSRRSRKGSRKGSRKY